jgi:hypothetical protein
MLLKNPKWLFLLGITIITETSFANLVFRCPHHSDIRFVRREGSGWKYTAYAPARILQNGERQYRRAMQGNNNDNLPQKKMYWASWLEGSFICNYRRDNLAAHDLVLWVGLFYENCQFKIGHPRECDATEHSCDLTCG